MFFNQLRPRILAGLVITAAIGAVAASVMLVAQSAFESSFESGSDGEIWESLPPFGESNDPSLCANSTGDDTYELDWDRRCARSSGGTQEFPALPGQLLRPVALAVDGERIYVADQANHRIQAFEFDGTPILIAHPMGNGAPGTGPYSYIEPDETTPVNGQKLHAPGGLAVDLAHKVVVGEYSGHVSVFDPDGAPSFIDGDGAATRLQVVDPLLGTIPTAGGIALSPGATVRGFGVAPPLGDSNHRIVVTDPNNCFVYIYDSGFRPLFQIPARRPNGSPWQSGVDVSACVESTPSSTAPLGYFSGPAAAAIDEFGHIFVADYANGRVQILAADGTPLGVLGDQVGAGKLWGPAGVMVDHLRRVVVADAENQRLAFFNVTFAPPVLPETLERVQSVFMFELRAGGTLTTPAGVVEQKENDLDPNSLRRLITVDAFKNRLQPFRVANLAIINPVITVTGNHLDQVFGVGTFEIAVPAGRAPLSNVFVTAVGTIGATVTRQPYLDPDVAEPIAADSSVTYRFEFAPAPGAIDIEFDVAATATYGTPSSTTSSSSKLKWHDTTAPVFTVDPLPNVFQYSESVLGAVVTFGNPEAIDAVGPVTVFCSASDEVQASGRVFAQGNTQVFCKATDGAGNQSISTFTVTVSADAPPAITTPGNITAEATSFDAAVVNFTVTASDTVDGDRPVTCSPVSGSVFPFNAPAATTTTVTCTAEDSAGNPASESFTVTVQDTVGPVITVPDDITTEATGPLGALVGFEVTAVDFVWGDRLFACEAGGQLIVNPAAGTTFAIGTTTVTCSAVDAAAHQTSRDFTVTVRDTTEPEITMDVSGVLAEATGPSGAVVNLSAEIAAVDLVDGQRTVSCSPASGSLFPYYAPGPTTQVTCTATDLAGNQAERTTTVTVRDTTGPVFAPLPQDITVPATSSIGADVTFALPAATDAVGPAVAAVTCDPAPGVFSPGVTVVTCQATDDAGNTSTVAFNVNVQDATGPVITASPLTIEATGAGGAAVNFAVSASDAIDGERPVSCTAEVAGQPVPVAPGAQFPLGLTTVTCSSSDLAGNTEESTFTVTVVDTTGPALTVPAGILAEATTATGATVSFSVTAADLVDGSTAVSCAANAAAVASPSLFNLGTTTVTCTATDAAGNSTVREFAVTVQDTTAPVFTSPPVDLTVPATSELGAVVDFTLPAATDAVGPVMVACTVSGLDAGGRVFAYGATEVTCLATDGAGNFSTTTFTVTVEETTPPTIATLAPATVEATSAAGAVFSFVPPTATAATGGSLTAACSPISGSTFELGTTTVTCSATDLAGNTSESTFIVTVQDTVGPVITAPAAVTAEVTGPDGATVDFSTSTSAFDAVDGETVVSCAPASGALFPYFAPGPTTIVTCTATDSRGNRTERTLPVTVRDTVAPVFTLPLPSDIRVRAESELGAVVGFALPPATDAAGLPTVTCTVAGSDASGRVFSIASTTVTCTATDDAGNSASTTFVVTVTEITPPTIATLLPAVVEATSAAGAVFMFDPPAANDGPGVPLTAVCVPGSGSTFPLGTPTTVTCTATDEAENSSSSDFSVTVRDTTGPAITVPGNLSAEATGSTGAPVSFSTSALDAVDGVKAVSCVIGAAPVTSPWLFALGTQTVTCRAADDAGNTSERSFTVTVVDTTGPAITVPADIIAEAIAANGATVNFSVTAADLVDGSTAVSCSTVSGPAVSGATFPLGPTVVTCTAVDNAGNPSPSPAATFTITVRDTTRPTVTVPANIAVEAMTPSGASVAFSVSAFDSVDATPSVSCTTASGPVVSGATFPLGSTVVTCTATDNAGNSSLAATFTITVRDTARPTIVVPADITAEATAPNGAAVNFTVSAADRVDTTPSVSCTTASGSVASGAMFPLGSTPVTCIAADDAGNTSEPGTFVVIVRDRVAPVLAQPANLTALAPTSAGAIVSFALPAATDAVGPVTVACLPGSGSLFRVGLTTVSCTATDGAGNFSTKTFTVTVTDNQPPVCRAAYASPAEIWPPNHKRNYVTVKGVTDPNGDAVTIKITGIFQDEPVNAAGDGNTAPDGGGVGTSTAWVLGERMGGGNGRVYEIRYTATDAKGASCTGTVYTTVPKSKGQPWQVIDSGVRYDSTQPASGGGHDDDEDDDHQHDRNCDRNNDKDRNGRCDDRDRKDHDRGDHGHCENAFDGHGQTSNGWFDGKKSSKKNAFSFGSL